MRTVVYGAPDFEVIRRTLTNVVIFGIVDARSFFRCSTCLRWCLCMMLWQVEVKVKLALSTPWRHIVGLQVQLLAFLSCVLDGSEWTSCPGRFNPGVHCSWGCVDFTVCLDVLEKWQLSYPSQQSNHGSSIKQNCYKLIQDLLSYFFHTAFALGIFSKFSQLWRTCIRATCRVTMFFCQVYSNTQCTVLSLMSVYYVNKETWRFLSDCAIGRDTLLLSNSQKPWPIWSLH
jgi:hypothetical protein